MIRSIGLYRIWKQQTIISPKQCGMQNSKALKISAPDIYILQDLLPLSTVRTWEYDVAATPLISLHDRRLLKQIAEAISLLAEK